MPKNKHYTTLFEISIGMNPNSSKSSYGNINFKMCHESLLIQKLSQFKNLTISSITEKVWEAHAHTSLVFNLFNYLNWKIAVISQLILFIR